MRSMQFWLSTNSTCLNLIDSLMYSSCSSLSVRSQSERCQRKKPFSCDFFSVFCFCWPHVCMVFGKNVFEEKHVFSKPQMCAVGSALCLCACWAQRWPDGRPSQAASLSRCPQPLIAPCAGLRTSTHSYAECMDCQVRFSNDFLLVAGSTWCDQWRRLGAGPHWGCVPGRNNPNNNPELLLLSARWCVGFRFSFVVLLSRASFRLFECLVVSSYMPSLTIRVHR